jgi:hypothetical protein
MLRALVEKDIAHGSRGRDQRLPVSAEQIAMSVALPWDWDHPVGIQNAIVAVFASLVGDHEEDRRDGLDAGLVPTN